jgi:hypothetical protein
METTAGETRSAAETSAVFRDEFVAFCASLIRAAVCAPADATRMAGARSLRHPVAASRPSSVRLREMCNGMRLFDQISVRISGVFDCREIEAMWWGRGTRALIILPPQEICHVRERPAS